MDPLRQHTPRHTPHQANANTPIVIPGSISSDSIRKAASDVGWFVAHTVPFVSVAGAVGYAGANILMTDPGAAPLTGVFLVLPCVAGGLATAAMHALTDKYARFGVAYPTLRALGDTLTRVVAPTALPALGLCSLGSPGWGLLAALAGGTTALVFEDKRHKLLDKLLREHRR